MAFFFWTPVSLEVIVRQWFSLKGTGQKDCFQKWKLFEARLNLQWCLEIVLLGAAPIHTQVPTAGTAWYIPAVSFRFLVSNFMFFFKIGLCKILLSFFFPSSVRTIFSLWSKCWPSEPTSSPISGWVGEEGWTWSPQIPQVTPWATTYTPACRVYQMTLKKKETNNVEYSLPFSFPPHCFSTVWSVQAYILACFK